MSYAEDINTIVERSGSPIEIALGVSMYAHLTPPITIKQQVPIGKYRADFLVLRDGREVVVEADGHGFHERTKEQAAHDRKRDRWMTAQGYRVLRFTGSEIWADVLACVQEVDDILGVSEPATIRPTFLMDELSRILEDSPNGLTDDEIFALVKAKRKYVLLALQTLTDEGHVTWSADAKQQTYRLRSVSPYRNEDTDIAAAVDRARERVSEMPSL